ncbi:MAG: hypothetical protein AAF728_19875 [Cyanobacteria bacterium P01_D01_bin.128]
MRQQRPRHHRLLWLAAQATKYFLLTIAACTLVYLVALALNFGFLMTFLDALMAHLFYRALVLLLCLVSAAAIAESI